MIFYNVSFSIVPNKKLWKLHICRCFESSFSVEFTVSFSIFLLQISWKSFEIYRCFKVFKNYAAFMTLTDLVLFSVMNSAKGILISIKVVQLQLIFKNFLNILFLSYTKSFDMNLFPIFLPRISFYISLKRAFKINPWLNENVTGISCVLIKLFMKFLFSHFELNNVGWVTS